MQLQYTSENDPKKVVAGKNIVQSIFRSGNRYVGSPMWGSTSLQTADASGLSGSTSLNVAVPLFPTVSMHELQTEIVRKSIHLLIALVPGFASIVGVAGTILILGAGTLLYTIAEAVRLEGRSVAVISYVTAMSARPRDAGRFVLGPVTLGLGAMIALLLYPEPAASLAIYSLAFGDGLSSFVGKLLGRTRIPFTGGKTIAGSMACFVSVFFLTFYATNSLTSAVLIGSVATLLEMVPVRDLDNLILPVGVGLLANRLLM